MNALKKGSGYDHCWVLNNQDSEIHLASTIYQKPSGCNIKVFTDKFRNSILYRKFS